MQNVLNLSTDTVEEIVSVDEWAPDEEFAFEIEELDGTRAAAMMLAVLDPCPNCHSL